MRKIYQALLILAFITFCLTNLTANEPALTPIKTWTNENGLSGNDVRVISQSQDGAIWAGTRHNGLSRYYQGEWSHIDTSDGLLSNGVIAIHQAKNGDIWFAGGGGVTRFDGKDWQKFPLAEMGLKGRVIFAIHEAPDGLLWFGGAAGAAAFDGSSWKTITMEDGLAHQVVHDVQTDANGTWFCTRKGGLNYLSDQKWQVFYPEKNSRALLLDAAGNLWVGTGGAGILRFNGKEWTEYHPGETWIPQTVDNHGNVWFASETAGIMFYNDSNWQAISTENGLRSNTVRALTFDEEGKLWIGSDVGVDVVSLGK